MIIHHLFEAQVEKTPEAIAVVFEAQELSYRELNRRANRLARYLQGLGVGPEILVGVSVERSLEMVIGLLAVLKAGGAYVPLDPELPPERRSFVMCDAGVSFLLTGQLDVEGGPDEKCHRRCDDLIPFLPITLLLQYYYGQMQGCCS